MAITKKVILCPHCKNELENASIEVCPVCNFYLKEPENPDFATPDYINFQMEDCLTPLKTEPDSPKKQDRFFEILANKRKFWQNTLDETRIKCISDTYDMMKDLIHSNASTDAIKEINGIAKNIGALALGIETTIKAGGYLHGNAISKAPKTRDSDEDSLQAAGVGD